jgi:hypothetical protein
MVGGGRRGCVHQVPPLHVCWPGGATVPCLVVCCAWLLCLPRAVGMLLGMCMLMCKGCAAPLVVAATGRVHMLYVAQGGSCMCQRVFEQGGCIWCTSGMDVANACHLALQGIVLLCVAGAVVCWQHMMHADHWVQSCLSAWPV